jgi:membrane fusion protein, copper/silver efflux system
MKNKFLWLLLALVGAAAIWFGKFSSPALATPPAAMASVKTLYTCGMHPQVIQDHPGDCPICGMKLTPIRNHVTDTNAMNSSVIAVDAATQQNMNLRTTEIQRGPLRKMIRTVGTVDFNETTLADVTVRFKGWVEKLNVAATGQRVQRGDALFEVQAPELYDAQVEFLRAVTNSFKQFKNVIVQREAAIRTLKNFGVSDVQIAEIETNRKVLKTLTVAAPISGFVIEKNIVAGQMVETGIKLYRLADLGSVWVLAQVYESDLALVKLGQEASVKVAALPGREFRGRVGFIYPTVDEKTRTAKVRLALENSDYVLKPGMFASVQIQIEVSNSAVLVPDSAVLRSGTHNTVFVALDGGKFEAREVVLGVAAENGLLQVISGVNAGERVVTSGQFLLDSESQLREAIEKMRGPTAVPKMEMKEEMAAENFTNAPAATPAKQLFTCPMHPEIITDHPGKCPKCKMDLMPVKVPAK